MTITIYEGNDNNIMLGSKDERFREVWGEVFKAPTLAANLYKDLAQISFWCNNELGEECLFEIE